jgi:hypothetical protein
VAGACFPTFDNLRGKLDLPALESFMTESNYSARVPFSPTVVIATAGIEQDLDMDSEEEFKKGTRSLGRVLRRAMKEDKLWCDNIRIERCTTSDQGYRDVPGTCLACLLFAVIARMILG